METDEASQLSPSEILWFWESLARRVGETDSQWLEPREGGLGHRFMLSLAEAGAPSVMVAIEPDEKGPDSLSGKNVEIGTATISMAGRRQRGIRVTCREPRLRHVFAELVASIHRRLRQGRSGHAAVRDAVVDFRRLLDGGAGDTVTREVAAGLAGELMLLKTLVEADPSAWKTWEGPEGGEHDFHRGGKSFEVKTSTRRAASTVEIHGIRQLDPPAAGLHLVHQTLIPDADGDISVPSLVADIEGRVADPAGFYERLSAADYSHLSAHRWELHRFTRGLRRFFVVGKEFPRLTPDRLASGDLDPGIDGVTFSLRLDAITGWEIPQDESDAVVSEFLYV
ncbi:PD-(D/E)XK motif protein [Thioalkalivibrio sp. ALMg3]|uniref:PD-(D/E)XK motif protein n=1 Tax=Thioalkalivibrio sp. ALMg3 TaxID=1158163 RepID=UPI00036AEE75|nr:PD-(D/E)XK motif protein [Thioalkalivibrio sp. ALMg3]